MILLAIIVSVIFLPIAYIVYDVHTDPRWIEYAKNREEAFKRWGEYPPDVHVDFWGNKSLDQKRLLKWLIKTGQFREDMIQSDDNLKFEWVKEND